MSSGERGPLADRPMLAALLPVGIAGGIMLVFIGICVGYPCFSTGLRYGLWLDHCPATDLRLQASVQANGLVRGVKGNVEVRTRALFLDGEGVEAYRVERGFTRGSRTELALVDHDGNAVDGMVVGKWSRSGDARRVEVTLPTVPDGDYTLQARVRTAFEEVELEVPLALYAPAIVHLMTDRPLYKPGQEVLLRSAVLKRTDLTPLDGRPGKWRVLAPDGTEMLVERDTAGPFGVADSSFPLDDLAEVGTWRAVYESGAARDEVSFQVRPFQLPRFTVELTPSATWYGIGDELLVDGVVRYTSGAPVADAPVELRVSRASGRWPPPLAWEDVEAQRTGPDGRFRLDLGEVPGDLVDLAKLSVWAQATDDAGETAAGAASLVLSKDDLLVEAVTELGDGLVEGFNNRAYLRVATPDGKPVRNAQIAVHNPWDEGQKPREADTDVDGVAAVQLDPGAPVTVVIPGTPVRVRPLTPGTPSISTGNRYPGGHALDLAERRALDAIVPEIARCGDLAPGGTSVSHGVRVGPSGAVQDTVGSKGLVPECVERALRRVRFGSGAVRTYHIGWSVPDSLRPSLSASVHTVAGSSQGVEQAYARASVLARRCMPREAGISGVRAFELHWRQRAGTNALAATVQSLPGTGLSSTALGCVRQQLSAARLDKSAEVDAMGSAVFSLSVPGAGSGGGSGPTTRTAYELKVTASSDGARIGSTRLILNPGAIPSMRLRATPSLAYPGDSVKVEMFRGPDWRGDLPKKLELYEGSVRIGRVDVEKNAATFVIPEDAEGFLRVDYGGARVVIFARPREPLSVDLTTDRGAYRPGETAVLTVTTRAGERPTEAGVGLVGVDKTLSQLAPLLGPDDYGRVTVRATSTNPAFGAFDPRALSLGQVQGENAAKAAVLRISELPMDAAGDDPLYATGERTPDETEALTRSFYRGLERTIGKVRAWEKEAPPGEVMQPPQMVSMWNASLKELASEDLAATDAYGRTLTLDVLPPDLLAQLDPRQMVADGTRLPEDIISWTGYIDEEVR